MSDKLREQKLDNYYKEINAILPYSKKQKKKFISDFKESVNNFIEENTNVSFEQICERFGSPEDIVNCDTEFDSYNIISVKNKSKKKLAYILVSVIICLSLLTISLIFMLNKSVNTNRGYITAQIESTGNISSADTSTSNTYTT